VQVTLQPQAGGDSFEYLSGPTFTADYGIGLERKFDNFILSPEFRYSHGLIHKKNPRFNGAIFLHNLAGVMGLKG